MKLRKTVLTGVAALALVASGFLMAQGPRPDIDPHRHPNLAEAQRMIEGAFNKVSEAQAANDKDMEGHAARAKELLGQASHELKIAAEMADKNHR